MPARNAQILILTALVCFACYMQAKRLKYAGRIGRAIEMIEDNYIYEVKGDDLYQAAMRGLLKLDPYSEFIPKSEYVDFQATIEQQFGGVGILIEGPPTSQRLMVITPLANTPAYRAGVQPGDEIVQIEGESTENMTSDDARDRMRGIVGTPVTIGLRRAGSPETIELRLVRADIQVDSVVGDHVNADATWNYFLPEDPQIAYVRISLFGERTTDEFREVLRKIKPRAKALVIDLRFNPGGVLSAAVDMCDMLLSHGDIVSTKGRRSSFDATYSADSAIELPESIPVVIMQNGQSASASEIMAACLQDSGRAKVAGERSFGKGTVQQVFESDEASTAIKLTTARYLRPNGKNIHRKPEMKPDDVWGVQPDKELEMSLAEPEQINLFRRWRQLEDPRRANQPKPPSPPFSGDLQLRRVVEYLQSRSAEKP